jgi:hypothetical protein
VQAARNRADLFPSDKLRVIFGNLEDILSVHNRFLNDLENEHNKEMPATTCVGHCFLRHVRLLTALISSELSSYRTGNVVRSLLGLLQQSAAVVRRTGPTAGHHSIRQILRMLSSPMRPAAAAIGRLPTHAGTTHMPISTATG